jgi:hypothetical protein
MCFRKTAAGLPVALTFYRSSRDWAMNRRDEAFLNWAINTGKVGYLVQVFTPDTNPS